MSHRLIADVGGTNVRFALVAAGGTSDPLPRTSRYTVADLADCAAGIDRFVSESDVDAGSISECVIAAAGPLLDGVIRLTNAHWVLSEESISQHLDGAQVQLLNDLEAIGYLLPLLDHSEITTMDAGNPPQRAPLIAVNVGTGFNSSVAVPLKQGWTAMSAESGHAALSGPALAESDGVVDATTVESVLSGPGLARLRDASPEKATRIFSRVLGLSVRDLVLATGSWGGAYLCGGVIQNAPDLIDTETFFAALHHKGPMAERLLRVPIHRITTSEPTLKALARITL